MKMKVLTLVVLVIVAVIAIIGAVSLQGSGTTNTTTFQTSTSQTEQRSINVKGSTTVLPIAQAAAEAWMDSHTGDRIIVEGGGSGVGIASLIDGTCDIANSSRELKEAEKESRNLIEHVIALDAVCVIVNSSNQVEGLTLDQIKQIFKGEITNWSQVGGADLAIAVYTRDSTSGTYETFWEKAMKPDNITTSALSKSSNGEMAQAISGNRNGIGYVGIGYLANASGFKGLAINGIEPSIQTVQDGTFPLWRHLYMITDGQPQGLAKDFIDFLKSSSGQAIVEGQGFVRLP